MTGLTLPTISARVAVESDCLIIDVRSPAEFVRGHVPGAVNLPLLDDEQRGQVGSAYNHEGARSARMRAVELVASSLPVYLSSISEMTSRGLRPAVMCWRGGERSRNVVLLLALVGIQALQVEGGYKAYRRWVIDSLAAWRPPCPVFTLYGFTGSGKSALLRAITAFEEGNAPCSCTARRAVGGPVPWVVDLEELALHRGSLLGGLNQPGERSQRDFEGLLWNELRQPRGDYLVLEGEGAKIGAVVLPRSVAAAVREGIPVLVESDREARGRRIIDEYSPETWSAEDAAVFRRGLELIAPRLHRDILLSLRTAFDDGRFDEVVKELLVHYYDPLYLRSSVRGRDFVFTLDTSFAPEEDARRLVSLMRDHLERSALKRRV